jgi:hypothetical protein
VHDSIFCHGCYKNASAESSLDSIKILCDHFPTLLENLKHHRDQKRTRFLHTAVLHGRLGVLQWYEYTCHPATTIGANDKDDDHAASTIEAHPLAQALGKVNGSDDDDWFERQQ